MTQPHTHFQFQNTQDKQCSVCLDNINTNEFSCKKCKNEFHDDCIQKWVNIQNRRRQKVTCPMCRATLKQDTERNRIIYNLPRRTQYIPNDMGLDNYIEKIVTFIFNFLIALLGIILLVFLANKYYTNFPTPCVPIREEINDKGECQWDPSLWCANRGYIWFKSENHGSLCNTDFCYKITYTNNYY